MINTPNMTSTQPDSTIPQLPVGTDEENLKLASQIAAVNLLFAQRELGNRIIDPTITTKGLLDIAEHSYRVSGMQKKVERQENGPAFSIQIVIPGQPDVTISSQKGETYDAVVDETPVTLAFAASTLIFENAPEFCGETT